MDTRQVLSEEQLEALDQLADELISGADEVSSAVAEYENNLNDLQKAEDNLKHVFAQLSTMLKKGLAAFAPIEPAADTPEPTLYNAPKRHTVWTQQEIATVHKHRKGKAPTPWNAIARLLGRTEGACKYIYYRTWWSSTTNMYHRN